MRTVLHVVNIPNHMEHTIAPITVIMAIKLDLLIFLNSNGKTKQNEIY